MKQLLIALTCLIAMSTYAQDSTEVSYQEFMIGTFHYCDGASSVVEIGAKKSVETITEPRGEVVIVYSKVKWLSEDKYQLTVYKTKGDTPIKRGVTVIVKIKEIKGNEVQLACTFSTGQNFGMCFVKQ